MRYQRSKARDKGCRGGIIKAKGEATEVSDEIFAWPDPAPSVLEFPATCSLIGLKSAFSGLRAGLL